VPEDLPGIGMSRAAIYARVSTVDRGQHTENQVDALVGWAERLEHCIVEVYVDEVSGAKDERARPALAKLLGDAHQRRFDVVLIFALDRLSRGGIAATGRILEKLKAAGVEVRSLHEPWLSTEGPVGELLVAIFSWLAKQERERLRERINAGLVRARKEGKQIGRPPRSLDILKVRALQAQGKSIRAMALELNLDERTLRRNLKLYDGEGSA
jgi:DNA invertase Pin-like site-specific DNA recombinase